MRSIDFIKNRKLFLLISVAFLALGLILNIIMGTELDIQFKGGTLLRYSYTGTLDEQSVIDFVQTKIPQATIDFENDEITITSTENIESDVQTTFKDQLAKQYPGNSFAELSTTSPQPAYGHSFFIKCLVAIALASLFLVIYVGIRFRRIGGVSAAVMALLALLHDILMAYFTFVVFGIPLNDNFFAVVLTILGYSLNDTIVIYDRIRENRRKLDKKTSIGDIVNLSLNQSLSRNVITTFCVFIAIATVAVVAFIASIDSILSFALPMTVGVVAGFYSSTFVSVPMWALWVEYSEKRASLKEKTKKK